MNMNIKITPDYVSKELFGYKALPQTEVVEIARDIFNPEAKMSKYSEACFDFLDKYNFSITSRLSDRKINICVIYNDMHLHSGTKHLAHALLFLTAVIKEHLVFEGMPKEQIERELQENVIRIKDNS